MAAIPYVLYGTSDEVFAYRGGVAIKVSQFLRDVEGLARSLPDRRYILNLCADRYQFAVGFSAALLRGQISLLPELHCQSGGPLEIELCGHVLSGGWRSRLFRCRNCPVSSDARG